MHFTICKLHLRKNSAIKVKQFISVDTSPSIPSLPLGKPPFPSTQLAFPETPFSSDCPQARWQQTDRLKPSAWARLSHQDSFIVLTARGTKHTNLLAWASFHGCHPRPLQSRRHVVPAPPPLPGSLGAVNPLVLDQVKAQAEGAPTLHAAERLLAGVDPLVPEEAGQGPEGAPTLAALIGLLPSVDAPVLAEEGASAEGAPALLACVGLLAGVHPLVLNEVGALAEGFPTFFTFIGVLSMVNSLVPNDIGTVNEGFPTFAALIQSLSSVDSPVLNSV
uniref:Uncharacterized protein n=1 Tax=Equus caballus TaxID=9796 RepID=A0A9L0SRP7_HORSE